MSKSQLILPGGDPRMMAAPSMPDPDTLLRRFEESIAQIADNNWQADPNVATLTRLRDELVNLGMLVSDAVAIVEKFPVQVSPTFVNHERFSRIMVYAAKGIYGFFRHLQQSGFTSEGAVNQTVQRFSLVLPI